MMKKYRFIYFWTDNIDFLFSFILCSEITDSKNKMIKRMIPFLPALYLLVL